MQDMSLVDAPGLQPGRCFRCGSIRECIDTRIEMNEVGGAWRIYVCTGVCAPEIARLAGGMDAQQAALAKQHVNELCETVDALEGELQRLQPAADLLAQLNEKKQVA